MKNSNEEIKEKTAETVLTDMQDPEEGAGGGAGVKKKEKETPLRKKPSEEDEDQR